MFLWRNLRFSVILDAGKRRLARIANPGRGGRLCPPGRNAIDLTKIPGESVCTHAYPVGADAYIGPADYTVFTEIFGEFVTSQRADVGIGPYKTPANPYFPASFERKAFLQQILNRSYSQIWCTITGGAYQIARRVSTCVRNICKSDSCLNRTAECTPRPQAPLFFPIFSGKTEKIGPSETSRSIIFP